MKTTLVIPVLYKEPQLEETLQALGSLRELIDLEILIVVDVPDPSRERETRSRNDGIAQTRHADVLYRVGERGFGSALRSGFARATGDVMIPLMGDASEDPEDVLRLLEGVQRGWDVVAGSRYMPGGRIIGDTSKQRLSRWYSKLCRRLGGPDIHDVSNAFKAYRRAVIESIQTIADSFDISVELTVKAHLAGFRVGETPTTWTNRREGSSNFSIRREVRNYGRWLMLPARERVRRRGPRAVTVPPPSAGPQL